MNTTTRWSFTIFHNGVRTRSPRLFDKKEDALQAIVDKLSQDALDGQYPCVGLVAIITPETKVIPYNPAWTHGEIGADEQAMMEANGWRMKPDGSYFKSGS